MDLYGKEVVHRGKKMRIVIDCFKQIKGLGKSIGIYNVALNLIKNLVTEKNRTINPEIRCSELIVLGNDRNREDFDIDGVNFIVVPKLDPTNKMHCIYWELFGVSRMCKKLKADRILFPRGYCGLTHPVYDIVLIHDMIPFYYHEHFPDFFHKVENAYIMNRLKASAKSAKKVVTISKASKEDIIKYCYIDGNKISIIHNACNDLDYHEGKCVQANLYLCAITSNLPHKNAKGLLAGYAEYYQFSTDPLDLVVIGIEDTSCYEIPDEIRNHIICYKFIKNNRELYRIIGNSKIFLFLSLVEGFGLPPIEAMQLKVPVICSNTSSLPEVVGKAAILVDPKQPKDIADAINRLQHDENLQEVLVSEGQKNIERFSWESRAKRYWEVLLE